MLKKELRYMYYLFVSLLACLVLISCSDRNGPDETVDEIDLCRECGDGRTIIVTFENGVPMPSIDPIEDGECSEWNIQNNGFKGADTVFLNWTYVDGSSTVIPPATIPLSRKKFHFPCP